MAADNKTTVSYTETTTVSTDGKIIRQQETKVVGNPTSPEVRELMVKVSDKGSKAGDALLIAAGVAALGGGLVTGFNILSKRKKDERVINPDPEKIEDLKQRMRNSFSERLSATIDDKYTQEEKIQAKKELNAEYELRNKDIMTQLEQLKQKQGDT